MTGSPVRPMAHRTGRRDRLARPLWRLRVVTARASARVGLPMRLRPRRLALAGLLVLGAGALVLPIAPDGGGRIALTALAAGSPGDGAGGRAAVAVATADGPANAPVNAISTTGGSSLDALTGTSGLDPVDLIGKGVVVAALLYLTLRVLRRLQAGPTGGSRLLEVIETRALGPKASLHLVAIGERRLVVGLSPAGMVAIADLEAAELAEPLTAADAPADAIVHDRATLAMADLPLDLRTLSRSGWQVARRLVSGALVATPRSCDVRPVVVPGEGR